MRGSEKEGYPFLNDIPAAISVISVAVKKKPTMFTNTATGKRHYRDVNDKVDIRRVLHAIINTDCTAVVLSALGCGLGGHPPEDVAVMFKREIYRVGEKVPFIYFAVSDETNRDPKSTGNFEVFEKALVYPEVPDGNWRSAKDVYYNAVKDQTSHDFPDTEVLGDAGGSGTNL